MRYNSRFALYLTYLTEKNNFVSYIQKLTLTLSFHSVIIEKCVIFDLIKKSFFDCPFILNIFIEHKVSIVSYIQEKIRALL